MKLVFDDGREHEIAENDFKQIVLYANRQAHNSEMSFKDDAARASDKGDYGVAMNNLSLASRAKDIATITSTVKKLYF